MLSLTGRGPRSVFTQAGLTLGQRIQLGDDHTTSERDAVSSTLAQPALSLGAVPHRRVAVIVVVADVGALLGRAQFDVIAVAGALGDIAVVGKGLSVDGERSLSLAAPAVLVEGCIVGSSGGCVGDAGCSEVGHAQGGCKVRQFHVWGDG